MASTKKWIALSRLNSTLNSAKLTLAGVRVEYVIAKANEPVASGLALSMRAKQTKSPRALDFEQLRIVEFALLAIITRIRETSSAGDFPSFLQMREKLTFSFHKFSEMREKLKSQVFTSFLPASRPLQ